MSTQRTRTLDLADSMDILAVDIESEDGVASAAIRKAADRLREMDSLENEIESIRAALRYGADESVWIPGDTMAQSVARMVHFYGIDQE